VKRVIRLSTALTLALMLLLSLASPVLAIANPDSGPTIEQVDVYRHCLESDDMLVVVQYFVDYTVNPAETINQAFLGRLIAADGVTVLANVAPYSYYDKGYDHGVYAVYLGAVEAAGHWGTACTISFEGNPTLAWPGDPPKVTTPTLNWHATTTSQATELLLGSNVLTIANTLSDYWGIAWALVTETVEGTKLSSFGDQYFTNAIPYLREMVPNIFLGGIVAPEWEESRYVGSATSTMTGAVADDGGTMTNETLAANSVAVNDMTLLPGAPVAGDAYYFGDDGTYTLLTVNIGQSGVGVWIVVWEYYNGVAWTAHSNVMDLTAGFAAATGNRHVTFDEANDWCEVAVNGITAYWTRARVSAYTSIVTQPLGTQCWTNVPLAYRDALLGRLDGTMTGQALNQLAAWTTVDVTIVKGVLWLILTGFVAYFMAVSVRDLRPALFLVALMLPFGSLIGMLSLTVTIVSTLICILALGYAVFYAKSS